MGKGGKTGVFLKKKGPKNFFLFSPQKPFFSRLGGALLQKGNQGGRQGGVVGFIFFFKPEKKF